MKNIQEHLEESYKRDKETERLDKLKREGKEDD